MVDTLKKPGEEGDGVVDLDPIDVEAEYSNKSPTPQMSTMDKSAVARMVTGATPALLGMLFGASPLTAEDQIQQGQKYYEGGTPKKLVMTAGPDNVPVYTDSRDAVGMPAYVKPLRGMAGMTPKQAAFVDPKRPGEIQKGTYDPVTRNYYDGSGTLVLNAQEANPQNFTVQKDEMGRPVQVAANRLTGTPTAKSVLTESESSVLGLGPQGLVNANRGARQALAPINQATARIANNMIADRELARAQNGGVTGADIAAKIGILRTFAPAGVSSPEEMQRSSAINQALDTITKFGSNRVPPDYITEFRNLLKNDTDMQRQLAQQYGKNAVQAQPTQAAKNYLQNTIPQMPAAPSPVPPPLNGRTYGPADFAKMSDDQKRMLRDQLKGGR